MSIVSWLLEHRACRACPSTEFMYEDMESQSGRCLPVLYLPFDPADRSHWTDEGQILDFFCSLDHESPRVLDLGPGDGWPSLRLAPMVAEVVGVDASERRLQECRANARTLGATNVRFVRSSPGEALPFEDESFDGVVAASSVEQTPDPVATLREVCRVLKTGGRLRMSYESLNMYRGGRERIGRIDSGGAGRSFIDLYDRDPDAERATMVRIVVSADLSDVANTVGTFAERRFALSDLSSEHIERLECLRRQDAPTGTDPQPGTGAVEEFRVCRLSHPSGRTYLRLLRDAGFSEASGRINGGEVGARLFSSLRPSARPPGHHELRDYLLPIVDATVGLEAPIDSDPWITAVK